MNKDRNRNQRHVNRHANTSHSTRHTGSSASIHNPNNRSQHNRERKRKRSILEPIILGLAVLILVFGIVKAAKFIGGLGKDKDDSSQTTNTQVSTTKDANGQTEQEKPIDPMFEGGDEQTIPVGVSGAYTPLKREELEAAYNELPDMLKQKIEKYPEARQQTFMYKQWRAAPVDIDVTKIRKIGKFPNAIQWDSQIGFNKYGEDLVNTHGCGPISLYNIYVGLTGDTEKTPIDFVNWAANNGFKAPDHGGSYLSLMDLGARKLGLKSEKITFSQEKVENALKSGAVVQLMVGKGDFSKGTHFVFIQDKDDQGYIVNDPNSLVNSDKRWSYDVLAKQVQYAWVISK